MTRVRRDSHRHKSSRRVEKSTDNPAPKDGRPSRIGKFTIYRQDSKIKGGSPYKIDNVQFNGNPELKNSIKSLWPKDPPHGKFNILALSPKRVGRSLHRHEKRALLRELADTTKHNEEDMELDLFKGQSSEDGEYEEFHYRGKLSLAARFIIDLALRESDKEDCHLFAELAGCATPETVAELSIFLRQPLISLKELSTLIHCAARNIARSDAKNRSKEPVKLAIRTAGAIAAALEYSQGLKKRDEDEQAAKNPHGRLQALLFNTLKKAKWEGDDDEDNPPGNKTANATTKEEKEENRLYRYSRDLGCHSGLLLAGIQTYFMNSNEKAEDMADKYKLIIDVVCGLLTGVPQGGFLFGPLGSILKDFVGRAMKKEKDEREKLCQCIKEYFDETVWAPIFFDDEFILNDEKGRVLIGREEVKWKVFSKWYEQMIRWNQVYVNWHSMHAQK